MKKLLFLLMFLSFPLLANDDVVWRTPTDQSDGFYMVKFSNNDSLIVGHGYEMDLFFDAKTGKEIKRIPGNNEVFFMNNDRNFIRTNEPRTKFEIFDSDSFLAVDSLENDGIQSSASIAISKDERYLISNIPHGFRIWDLQTKKIKKTKIYPPEPNLIYNEVVMVSFTCDETKIMGYYIKTYQDPEHPGQEQYNKTYGYNIVYDFNTLDSIDVYMNSRGFFLSNSCKYFAVATGDPTYGVEVYDFNTKEQLWKLPVNGPSLTGIEFSSDDKFLVTSNAPGANKMVIWDLSTGKSIREYSGTSFSNMDISHDGQFIIVTISDIVKLYRARFTETSITNESHEPIIIFPNPASGIATLQFELEYHDLTNIVVSDMNGKFLQTVFNGFLNAGNQKIPINTRELSVGQYFVNIHNKKINFTYKLIINK